MSYKLSQRSQAKLVGVHPDLIRVVEHAITITQVDFSVVEGLRSYRKQLEYFTKGKSLTMKSRHLTGHAVDLAPWIGGTILWSDGPHWYGLALAMKRAAEIENVPIEWGGDWVTFVDKPHFQLPWVAYPA